MDRLTQKSSMSRFFEAAKYTMNGVLHYGTKSAIQFSGDTRVQINCLEGVRT